MISQFFITCGLITIVFSQLFDKFFYPHFNQNEDVLCNNENSYNIFSLLIYLLWLTKEMIVSSISLCSSILSIDRKVSSCFILYKIKPNNDFKKSILFYSITFTPGTISIDCNEESHIEIHSLATNNIQGVQKMEKYLMDNL